MVRQSIANRPRTGDNALDAELQGYQQFQPIPDYIDEDFEEVNFDEMP